VTLVSALAPEFTLIAIGWLLARVPGFDAKLWAPIERITYWVLFPALLFYANAQARVDLGAALPMILTALGIMASGALLAWIGRFATNPERAVFGGLFQCAFRFNAYIGLALASRLHGVEGLAAMSLVLGCCVPFANVAAVWGLASGRGGATIARELATNPLILSCVGGLLYGASGLPLPELVATTLSRFGSAALVLGLLAVGAALRVEAITRGGLYIPWVLVVKLAILPLMAWLFVDALGLGPLAGAIIVLYAALPLPSSAYVLAARLNGAPDVVALATTISILASLVTLPFWIKLSYG
jgi:malonate transporter and related proteins